MKLLKNLLISIMLVFSLFMPTMFVACGNANSNSSTDNSSSVLSEINYEVYDYSYKSSSYSDGKLTITSSCDNKEDAVMVIALPVSTDDYTQYVLVDSNSTTITIVKAGEYTLAGTLYGNIIINAGEDEDDETDIEVDLSFKGANIISYSTSPIYVQSCEKVKISAKAGYENNVLDYRSSVDETLDAAIYSSCDIKIKGSGTLNVISAKNRGIHTKDDLKIQNLTLNITSYDHALKGADSVSIYSGTITLVSVAADGIKTSNSGLSSKGNQKGTIYIGPEEESVSADITITIYSACDGIDAAYNAEIAENSSTNLTIYTSDYASEKTSTTASTVEEGVLSTVGYLAGPPGFGGGQVIGGGGGFGAAEQGNTNKHSWSDKGIKADNEIIISGGTIFIKSYDDALHTNNDVTIESTSQTGSGNIVISGGTLTLYSADDAIHADQDFTLSGTANITVTNSYEGIEANRIYVTGGSCNVYATDDAMNAANYGSSDSTGKYKPLIYISGGHVELDVASGDTDTMDSNGNITITGGVVIVKNRQTSGTSMTGGTIDLDGTLSISGNAIVISVGAWCGEANMSYDKQSTSQTLSSGTYYLKNGSNILTTFTLSTSYKGYRIYCPGKSSTETYTLYCGSSSVVTF